MESTRVRLEYQNTSTPPETSREFFFSHEFCRACSEMDDARYRSSHKILKRPFSPGLNRPPFRPCWPLLPNAPPSHSRLRPRSRRQKLSFLRGLLQSPFDPRGETAR